MGQGNLQTDIKTLTDVMTKLLHYIEEYTTRSDSEWERYCHKEIMKHINLGGSLMFNKIPDEFLDDLTANLKSNDVPYSMMSAAGGEKMVIVRDADADMFYLCQKNVYGMSSKFAKAVTEDAILQSSRMNNNKEIYTVLVENDAMRETTKHKLHQCGIVFAEHETPEGETELIIQQQSIFSRDGKDLAFYELEHAMIQSTADDFMSACAPDYFKTRMETNAYDLKKEDEFVEAVKTRKPVVIIGEGNPPDRYIESAKDGVYLYTYDEKVHDYTVQKFDSLTKNTPAKDIKATLSFNMEKMDDMLVIPKEEFANFKSSGFNRGALDKSIRADRPKYMGSSLAMKALVKQDVMPVIHEINRYATAVALADKSNTTPESRYIAKKQIIAGVLKDPKRYAAEVPSLAAFVSKSHAHSTKQNAPGHPAGAVNMSLETSGKLVDAILTHFSNTAESGEYECAISKRRVSEIARETGQVASRTAERVAEVEEEISNE